MGKKFVKHFLVEKFKRVSIHNFKELQLPNVYYYRTNLLEERRSYVTLFTLYASDMYIRMMSKNTWIVISHLKQQ